MPNVSDNKSIVHPKSVDHFECSRVENAVNQYRHGDMDGSTRIFPAVVKHLSELMLEVAADREERKKYFELFGWNQITDACLVPKGEMLLCRSREDNLDDCYYCVDVLPEDVTEDDELVFAGNYDAYMRVPLCPYPPMIQTHPELYDDGEKPATH